MIGFYAHRAASPYSVTLTPILLEVPSLSLKINSKCTMKLIMPLHSLVPEISNCNTGCLQIILFLPSCDYAIPLFCFIFWNVPAHFKLNHESSVFSPCLLRELRNPKGLGRDCTVRMRSSLGKETKSGRCVAVLAHLGHPFTVSWDVQDNSDKEDRSLKGLKNGSFSIN